MAKSHLFNALQVISIHALREEGDVVLDLPAHIPVVISIHALREEGDGDLLPVGRVRVISIHALREEGDELRHRAAGSVLHFYPRPPRGGRPLEKLIKRGLIQFLSTPSARRATVLATADRRCRNISIHALREEGDLTARGSITPGINFYPRPPRGGRPMPGANAVPHRGISIHALREEGDM